MAESELTNLWLKPISEIKYEDVNDFCNQQHQEDIDLDYKKDFPKDLENLLAAFANTQGGMVIIGIEEEEKTRKPICPPIGIDGPDDVIRQKIQNIAFDNIYPPLELEISINKIPDKQQYIALIRADPSNLVHSTDRRKRIYIRSQDNNRGYELASLADLRWLWNKRESSIRIREQLIEDAQRRANSDAIRYSEEEGKEKWFNSPHLLVSIIPAFPKTPIIPSTKELFEIINSLPQVRSTWHSVIRSVPWQAHHWRTNNLSVCLSERGTHPLTQYIEFGVYGHSYFDFQLHRQNVSSLPLPRQTNEECIHAYVVLAYLDIALKLSSLFNKSTLFRWPVIINARLSGIEKFLLQYQSSSKQNTMGLEYLSNPSTENEIVLFEDEINASSLDNQMEHYVNESARSLFWGFGVSWSVEDIEKWLVTFVK